MDSVAAALEDAKAKNRPALVFFWDGSRRNMMFEEGILKSGLFGGAETWGKVSFAKLKYIKGSPEAKELRVRSAPSLVLVDNSKDKPKVVKTFRSGHPASIKKAIDALVKKLSK